jgi:hypothetical protein
MRKHKKLMVVSVLAGLALLMLALGSTAFASTDDDASPRGAFLSKVTEILGLEDGELSDAMDQAREEMREEAQAERLAHAVEDGVITQEQADEISAWWDARPEVLEDAEVRQALARTWAAEGSVWAACRAT